MEDPPPKWLVKTPLFSGYNTAKHPAGAWTEPRPGERFPASKNLSPELRASQGKHQDLGHEHQRYASCFKSAEPRFRYNKVSNSAKDDAFLKELMGTNQELSAARSLKIVIDKPGISQETGGLPRRRNKKGFQFASAVPRFDQDLPLVDRRPQETIFSKALYKPHDNPADPQTTSNLKNNGTRTHSSNQYHDSVTSQETSYSLASTSSLGASKMKYKAYSTGNLHRNTPEILLTHKKSAQKAPWALQSKKERAISHSGPVFTQPLTSSVQTGTHFHHSP
jgi:hypothetical protein